MAGAEDDVALVNWFVQYGSWFWRLLDLQLPSLLPVLLGLCRAFHRGWRDNDLQNGQGEALLQAKSPEAYRGRIFGVLGGVTGLLYLIGTLIAGIFTDRFGVVTVLNMQAVGLTFAGLLALVLLPREKNLAASQEEVVHPKRLPM